MLEHPALHDWLRRSPSKAPPSRRCVLDAPESLDFLAFSTRNSAE